MKKRLMVRSRLLGRQTSVALIYLEEPWERSPRRPSSMCTPAARGDGCGILRTSQGYVYSAQARIKGHCHQTTGTVPQYPHRSFLRSTHAILLRQAKVQELWRCNGPTGVDISMTGLARPSPKQALSFYELPP